MRKNRDYILENAMDYWRSSSYYLILLLLILNALFAMLVAAKINYMEGWITIETNSNFHAFFLAILLVDIMMQRRREEKLVGLHLYYKNRRSYQIQKLKQIVYTTIFLFLIQRLFVLIGLNIFNSSNAGFVDITNYSVPNWCYLGTLILRNLTYVVILALIIYQALIVSNEKYVVFVSILILVYFLGDRILLKPVAVIDQIWEIPLSLRQQFSQNYYSTFLFELAGDALYSCLLAWCSYFLFWFNMRKRGERCL